MIENYIGGTEQENKGQMTYCQIGYTIINYKGEINMDMIKFEEIINILKSKGAKIFELFETDCIPTIDQTKEVEEYYDIKFPDSYKEFLLKYGGGDFLYERIYSLDKKSSFYIKNNVTKEWIIKNNFLPIIDFGTGDLAGFEINNGVCQELISIYDHEDETISSSNFNLYDFLFENDLKDLLS